MVVIEYSVLVIAFILAGYLVFTVFEILYSRIFNKPFFINAAIILKKMTDTDIRFLEDNFSFYQKLTLKQKNIFQHRMYVLSVKKEFKTTPDFTVTNEMKLLVIATLVMLTFGMRNYRVKSVKTIVIYPDAFISRIKNQEHIGEFNPAMKAVVFSWKDFLKGYELTNDNLNLGIHEFSHALHYNSLQRWDISSLLFARGFLTIQKLLNTEEDLETIKKATYLRAYAHTNMYEFFAVCIEHYIESPLRFKKELPELYKILKQMMNYEFL